MDLVIHKKMISETEESLMTSEQPISCDVLLPDYYPDIARILDCRVSAQTTSVQTRGDKLNIDAIAVVEVIYQSEPDGIYGTIYRVPINKSLQLKAENPRVEVQIKPATPICKAISRRRIDVSGSLLITAKVLSQKEVEVICDAENAHIELKQKEIECAKKMPPISKMISLSEKVKLENSGSPISIVTTRGTPSIEEIKPAGTRVVVKGKLDISSLIWEKDEATAKTLSHCLSWTCLPESVDGEDLIYEASAKLISAESIYGGEYDPVSDEITINAVIEVTLNCYKKDIYKITEDAYSKTHATLEKLEEIKLTHTLPQISESFAVEEKFHLPEGVLDILLMEFIPESSNNSNNNILLRGVLSIIAKMNDGCFEAFERVWEMTKPISLDSEVIFEPNFQSESLKWSVDGDMLTAEMQVSFSGTPLIQRKMPIVSDIELREEEKVVSSATALIIYYAAAGEELWNIAKKYKSSVPMIKEINSIEEELLKSQKAIIIPTT